MDKGGDMAGSSANNSSDFVSLDLNLQAAISNHTTGSQIIQVSSHSLHHHQFLL